MANLPTVEELKAKRDAFNGLVRDYIEGRGETFIDKAISAPGARFILETLEEEANQNPGEHAVLDMGTGFSTFFVGVEWCRRRGWKYLGVEHDKTWLRFMRRLLDQSGQDYQGHVTLTTRGAWAATDAMARYFAIIVDQNPGLETRAKDTPRLTSQLHPDGVMLFDDWRPKHEGRIRRALAASPGEWIIGDGGDELRRFPRDKTIGWARRKIE